MYGYTLHCLTDMQLFAYNVVFLDLDLWLTCSFVIVEIPRMIIPHAAYASFADPSAFDKCVFNVSGVLISYAGSVQFPAQSYTS